MADPVIDNITGGAAANSYVLLAEADAYVNDYYTTAEAAAWCKAEQGDRVRKLLQATQRLQRENWIGDRATTTQALAWPRIGARKQDGSVGALPPTMVYGSGLLAYGQWYESTEIPRIVKDAQCALALALLDGTFDPRASERVTKFSADGLSVEKEFSGAITSLPPHVQIMLAGLILGPCKVRG